MHELPLVTSIYKAVSKKAEEINAKSVTRVVLEIGALRDFVPEIIQKYWDYVSKGGICDGAQIEVITIPAEAICSNCGTSYLVDVNDIISSRCPKCKCETGDLITGRELRIKGIEIT